jgi:hypothetical protein
VVQESKDSTENVNAAEFFQLKKNRQLCPLLFEVFEYWNAARAGEFAPNYTNIEIGNLPLKMIPLCAVLDVTPDGSDFIYRYWGTLAADALGKEMTGKSVHDLPSRELVETSFAGYQQVLEAKTALVSLTPYARAYNLDTHEIFMRLPMSSNGIDVNVILNVVEMPNDEIRNLKGLLEGRGTK